MRTGQEILLLAKIIQSVDTLCMVVLCSAFLWKVVEPTHMCQDDTHKSIRELHLSFHFID